MLLVIIAIIIALTSTLFWAFETKEIAEKKGHDGTEWFWRGFFHGRMGMIHAETLPNLKADQARYSSYSLLDTYNGNRKDYKPCDDCWKCSKCGTYNPNYTGTCSCGQSKHENNKSKATTTNVSNTDINTTVTNTQKANNTVRTSSTNENIIKNTLSLEDEIIKRLTDYKKLLDNGTITQEEFDNKKAELLALKKTAN